MRDVFALKDYDECPQPDGNMGFFFADTSIIAQKSKQEDGTWKLIPVRGDQVAHGEWYDLLIDEVADYCKLLEAELNSALPNAVLQESIEKKDEGVQL
jgi:hypothetical protein